MRQIAGAIFPSAVSSVRRLRLLLDVTALARSRSPYSVKMRGNVRRQKYHRKKNKSPAEPGFCSRWFWFGLLR
jgi:hypothetical protein